MRRPLLLVVPVVLTAGGIAAYRHARAHRPHVAAAAAAPSARPRLGLVPRIHYHLAYQQEIAMPMAAPVDVKVEGEWITTPRRDGRIEVRFVPAAIDGPDGSMPAAADVATPVQLVREDGVLSAMGFVDAMPAKGRALMTNLATTFQVSEQPGSSWIVAEEDLLGRYDAAYQRAGDTLVRSRDAYVSARSAGELSAKAAGDIGASEESRFVVDREGVVSADVGVALSIAISDDAPSAQAHVKATLARTSIEWVTPSMTAALAAEPISDHVDRAVARASADESRVAGATLDVLLAELRRLAALDGAAKATRDQRAHLMARLCAYLRLHPEAASRVADELRAQAANHDATRLLAGALGQARVAEGTDALAALALLPAGDLPAGARSDVLGALQLAEPPTEASLAALTASLDGPDRAAAALGLGVHSRGAPAELSDQAGVAVRTLLDRYASAGSAGDRVVLAQALGNTGSPAALPLLRELASGADPDLAEAALYGLRFVPGDDVDELLAGAIDDPDRALGAVRAIAYRAPATWRDRLIALQDRYAGRSDIVMSIRGTLRRWG
ncbi:MAG TPA: HEAT repeat domain-containing protein [Kofleriaceae bacterium]|nr:HEAT repeat domain-containing protein [Kofleriaceae bacterium]